MRAVGWVERQLRRADRFQQRHTVLSFPWAVARKCARRSIRSRATVALTIGIAGTVYGSLGAGFSAQNAMNTVWNIPHVRWPRFWARYARTLVLLAAEINVVLHYWRWPRSVVQPPLTQADRLVPERLAQMQVRRPEERISAAFTEAAGEDPLAGRR